VERVRAGELLAPFGVSGFLEGAPPRSDKVSASRSVKKLSGKSWNGQIGYENLKEHKAE